MEIKKIVFSNSILFSVVGPIITEFSLIDAEVTTPTEREVDAIFLKLKAIGVNKTAIAKIFSTTIGILKNHNDGRKREEKR